MNRWLAALILCLLVVGNGVVAFAGDESGDPPGHHGHHHQHD